MLSFIARLLGAIRICSDRPGSGDPLAIEEDYYRFQRAAQSRPEPRLAPRGRRGLRIRPE